MLVVCGFAPVCLATEALEQPSARQDGWMGIITGSQYRCSVDTCSGRRGSGRSLTPSPRLVRVPSGVIRSRSTAWLPRTNFGRDPTVDDLSSIKVDQGRTRSITQGGGAISPVCWFYPVSISYIESRRTSVSLKVLTQNSLLVLPPTGESS